MRITKITLENFRSFKTAQTIELAPVTLLFGPNSVGKSSILMALAYIRQILSHGHCDPQHLDALGRRAIGGFRALVYGQDTERSIRIRLDFESGIMPFSYYGAEVSDMLNHVQASVVLMDDFGGSITHGAVELEIAWSERYQWAYVREYRVWINGGFIGCIRSSDDRRNTVIRELNTRHPLLLPLDHEDLVDDSVPLSEQDEYPTEFEQVLAKLNPNPVNTAALADIEKAGQSFVNRVAPISLHCQWGAIPLLRNPVVTNLLGQEFDQADEHLNYLTVRQVLSQAFVLPLDKILSYLENTIQIGPLRLVPDTDYMPNAHPTQSDWVDGAAAWDLLHQNPERQSAIGALLRETNDWLANPDKLNTGYALVNESLDQMLGEPRRAAAPEISRLLGKRHLWFKDLRTDVRLSANQLGTGISQVLPIIVACHYDPATLVTVEQPELHIHPRLQTQLADVFLAARNRHTFLVETHSEHFILRLLRRIRQSAEGTLPGGMEPVKKNDVSIIYLEPSVEGVLAKRIFVDDDGEFLDRWPQGFFVERREELL